MVQNISQHLKQETLEQQLKNYFFFLHKSNFTIFAVCLCWFDLCCLMTKGFLNQARDSEEGKDCFIPEWPAKLSCNRRLYRPKKEYCSVILSDFN